MHYNSDPNISEAQLIARGIRVGSARGRHFFLLFKKLYSGYYWRTKPKILTVKMGKYNVFFEGGREIKREIEKERNKDRKREQDGQKKRQRVRESMFERVNREKERE